MRYFALIGLITLTGCMSFGALRDDLQALKGRPESDAIAALGPPDQSFIAAGQDIMVWDGDCRIKLAAVDGKIASGNYSGSNIGCAQVVQSFKRPQ